jgi:large subunit ribosomal protein L18
MDKRSAREKRHQRVRNKVIGTQERPRMSVYRSLRHIYVQLINDLSGHTLVSASSLDPAVSDLIKNGGNKKAARVVGELIAERALEQNIERVVFDRSGYKYHGRIKEVAEAARNKGLRF